LVPLEPEKLPCLRFDQSPQRKQTFFTKITKQNAFLFDDNFKCLKGTEKGFGNAERGLDTGNADLR